MIQLDHEAFEVLGDDSAIKFKGEVPRRGDRVIFRGKVHGRVTDVEWRISHGGCSSAIIYYETE